MIRLQAGRLYASGAKLAARVRVSADVTAPGTGSATTDRHTLWRRLLVWAVACGGLLISLIGRDLDPDRALGASEPAPVAQRGTMPRDDGG